MRLYLSPSNQPANKYAVGNTSEKEQMEAVALLVQEKLKGYDIEVIMADFNKGIDLKERPTDAAKLKVDFYLSIHSNAGGGKAVGAEGFYHPVSAISKELATELVKELNAICPYKSNRSQSVVNGMLKYDGAGYGEIRSPYSLGIPSIIIEVNFHDNPTLAQWIIDNKDQIADAIVKVLVSVFGLKKKEVKEVKEEIGQLVYNKVEEVPGYAMETIQKLIDKKYLNGDTKGNLNLSLDMVRIFVVHDRIGLYDR